MGFRDTVRAAQDYLDAEADRLGTLLCQKPPTVPEFTVIRNVTIERDTALVPIEPGHGPRRFDIPMVLFLELALGVGSRLRLNSRGPDKAAGKHQLYPRLDIPGEPGQRPLNMQLNRIIADPPVGRRVRENLNDHRNHLREGLRTDESPLEHGPGKSRTTRQDAIEAIVAAYGRAVPASQSAITPEAFERLLRSLLLMADIRATGRQFAKAMA